MGRKCKYPDGSPVGKHGLILVHRTTTGTNPRALFRYPDGRQQEHYVQHVASNRITGETMQPIWIEYEPGEVVGHGFKIVRHLGNGRTIFERDGKQFEKRFNDVLMERYTGEGYKRPRYVEGDPVGSYGALFAEYIDNHRAIFEWPNGELKEHYISSVERGSATGGERGRPLGRKTDWLTKKLIEGAKANARANR